MTNRRIAVLGVAYVVAAAAAAAGLVWPVFQTVRLLFAVGVGAAIGVGLGLFGMRFRWPGWVTALGGFVTYLLLAVPVAIPYRANSDGLVRGLLEAGAAIIVGWQRLLTLQLPVEDYRASLAPWLALTIAVSLAGTFLSVRSDRWAGWAAPVLGIPIVVAGAIGPVAPGAGLGFGPIQVSDGLATVSGAFFAVVTVAWFVIRARVRRAQALAKAVASTGGRAKRAGALVIFPGIAGMILVLVAALVGSLVTPLVSSAADRRTAREQAEPVLMIQAQPSPLDRYRLAFESANATAEMFTVSVEGDPVDRLRIAVLDAYDGEHFTVSVGESRDFIRMPRSAPADADSTVTIRMGDQTTGIWMPIPLGLAGAPTFSGARSDQLSAAFYVSESGSSAINVAMTGLDEVGLRPGDGYEIAVFASDLGKLGRPEDTPLIDAEKYPELAEWVKAQGQPRNAEGLAELVNLLRSRGYLSHWLTPVDADFWLKAEQPGMPIVAAYAGHSTSRIEDLFVQLNDQQEAVGTPASDADLVAAIGDDEQFASAAALIARYLGFESRVVLGVRLEGDVQPTCDGLCTGSDLVAWAEVRSTGGQWVPFDVDPQTDNPPRPVTQGQEPPSNATRVQQPDPEVVDPPDAAEDTSNLATVVPDPHGTSRRAWGTALRIGGLAIGILVLAALPALAIPAAKAVRRARRRRTSVPEVACVGAWAELEDRCLDLGMPLVGSTRRAAAAATARPGATALAELVDMAVFGSAPVSPQIRDDAWSLIEHDLADVYEQVSGWRRAKAWFQPRSMLNALSASDRYGERSRTPQKEPG